MSDSTQLVVALRGQMGCGGNFSLAETANFPARQLDSTEQAMTVTMRLFKFAIEMVRMMRLAGTEASLALSYQWLCLQAKTKLSWGWRRRSCRRPIRMYLFYSSMTRMTMKSVVGMANDKEDNEICRWHGR